MRGVGHVGAQGDEERAVVLLVAANELDRGVEEHVRSPAVDPGPLAVVEVVIVDAVVEEMIVGGAGAPVALALNGSVFSMVQALGATLGGVPSPAMASPPSRPRP